MAMEMMNKTLEELKGQKLDSSCRSDFQAVCCIAFEQPFYAFFGQEFAELANEAQGGTGGTDIDCCNYFKR